MWPQVRCGPRADQQVWHVRGEQRADVTQRFFRMGQRRKQDDRIGERSAIADPAASPLRPGSLRPSRTPGNAHRPGGMCQHSPPDEGVTGREIRLPSRREVLALRWNYRCTHARHNDGLVRTAARRGLASGARPDLVGCRLAGTHTPRLRLRPRHSSHHRRPWPSRTPCQCSIRKSRQGFLAAGLRPPSAILCARAAPVISLELDGIFHERPRYCHPA